MDSHQPPTCLGRGDHRTSTLTATAPGFIQHFFASSRLHHLSTTKYDLIDFVSEAMRIKSLSGNNIPATRCRNSKPHEPCRTIMHVDMDCYFVSVATRGQPALAEKPVAVAHSVGGMALDHSSSEIASCNYAARARGLKNGMFLGSAKSLAPDLLVLPYEFQEYDKCTKEVYRILLEKSNFVQAVSCDEAFIDVTYAVQDRMQRTNNGQSGQAFDQDEEVLELHDQGDSTAAFNSLEQLESAARAIAEEIRAEIFSATGGCCASIGISTNVLFARLSTKRAKPNGVFFASPMSGVGQAFLNELALADLPGVGWSMKNKLNELNLVTCRDMQLFVAQATGAERQQLVKALGEKTSQMLERYASGYDPRILSNHPRESIGSDINWGIRFQTHAQIDTFLRDFSAEVFSRLERLRFTAKHVTVKAKKRLYEGEPAKFLGCGHCEELSKSIALTVGITSIEQLYNHVRALYKHIGITASDPTMVRGIGIHLKQLEKLDPTRGSWRGGNCSSCSSRSGQQSLGFLPIHATAKTTTTTTTTTTVAVAATATSRDLSMPQSIRYTTAIAQDLTTCIRSPRTFSSSPPFSVIPAVPTSGIADSVSTTAATPGNARHIISFTGKSSVSGEVGARETAAAVGDTAVSGERYGFCKDPVFSKSAAESSMLLGKRRSSAEWISSGVPGAKQLRRKDLTLHLERGPSKALTSYFRSSATGASRTVHVKATLGAQIGNPGNQQPNLCVNLKDSASLKFTISSPPFPSSPCSPSQSAFAVNSSAPSAPTAHALLSAAPLVLPAAVVSPTSRCDSSTSEILQSDDVASFLSALPPEIAAELVSAGVVASAPQVNPVSDPPSHKPREDCNETRQSQSPSRFDEVPPSVPRAVDGRQQAGHVQQSKLTEHTEQQHRATAGPNAAVRNSPLMQAFARGVSSSARGAGAAVGAVREANASRESQSTSMSMNKSAMRPSRRVGMQQTTLDLWKSRACGKRERGSGVGAGLASETQLALPEENVESWCAVRSAGAERGRVGEGKVCRESEERRCGGEKEEGGRESEELGSLPAWVNLDLEVLDALPEDIRREQLQNLRRLAACD